MFVTTLFICLLFCCIQNAEPRRRIVGGSKVRNRTEFAYQASLRYLNAPYCGGTVIDQRHVLTAAHCCFNNGGDHQLPAKDLSVVVGNLDLYSDSIVKKVQDVFIHKDYAASKSENDIAILRIKGNFGNWSSTVRPIKLSTATVTSGQCVVSGWGTTVSGSNRMSPDLLYVRVPIVNWQTCYRNYGSIGDKVMCAGTVGKDSCQGDSGGPLVCNKSLSGIVSYGKGCAEAKYPGVYTDVSKYIYWIEEQKRRPSSSTNFIISWSLLLMASLIINSL